MKMMFFQYGQLLPVVKEKTKTMSLTKGNLIRSLPLLFSPAEFRIEENIVHVNTAGKQLKIHILMLPDLSLGSLRLPQILVKFCFHDHTDIQINEFMKHFNQIFHRGGG